MLRLFERHLEVTISKLSKGFASLPDELLALIFKYATHHEQEGTRHAFWLSHISRRFRRIVLGDRSLWSTQLLRYDSTKENIERCIHRSGNDSDLHIVINNNRMINFSACDSFIGICQPSASRWRSLTLVGEWEEEDGDLNLGDTLRQLLYRRHLVLPQLHELCLIQRHHNLTAGAPLWYPSSGFPNFARPWVTPNLRVMRCTQYIPPRSCPFGSITHFILSLTLLPGDAYIQVEELCMFLTSMAGLTEFDLELQTHDSCTAGYDLREDLEFVHPFLCASLTAFRLHVSGLSLPSGIYSLLTPFTEALQMPRLKHLSLSVDLRFTDVCYHTTPL